MLRRSIDTFHGRREVVLRIALRRSFRHTRANQRGEGARPIPYSLEEKRVRAEGKTGLVVCRKEKTDNIKVSR